MALQAVGGSASTLDKVTSALAEELRSGRWPVGSRIPGELVLSEQLKVSRPLVREAIRGLSRLGMLEPRQGAGTFVLSSVSPADLLSGIGRADVREIFEVQMAYDVQAAGMAAERRTDDDLVELRRLLALRDLAEDDRGDPQRFALDDSEFHLAVVATARNPVLVELYRYFISRLRGGLFHVHADLEIPSCGHESHRAILDAIAERNVAGAREAARRVVEKSLEPLRSDRGNL
ncbi:FadR/GntR family transcriptional regulator [Pseudonocardia sp. KRD291]|uniref:FadR/GntR family transcriptional regulator n=1 Tax=Pseudonocardia sp. KRD291 TaxID=2792007 RepID=UPI001C49DBC1|nr:FadR/GntR family transcriptional regulator [Pseudonocardia sp. KRD291]MBW0106166.1 FadR family transcriptional regulator [Pseudonocardia sp. KRD291]